MRKRVRIRPDYSRWSWWALWGVVISLQAGTPHLGYGTLRYADGSKPPAVNFSAHITARPAETLTQSSFGCGYTDGTWTVQVGNFPTAWKAGEYLRVAFDDGAGRRGSVELMMTNEPADNAGLTVLSPNATARLTLPDITAPRGSQIDIPLGLQGMGVADSIVGYQITLIFDPAVLIALGAKSTGTMTQNWGSPTFSAREDRIVIAGITSNSPSTRLIPDDGILVFVTFLVQGIPGDPASTLTAVRFDQALLYVINPVTKAITEVMVSDLKTGTVTVTAGSNPTFKDIPLNPGWNLISLGVIPSPQTLPDIFGGLKILYAYGYRPVEGPMSWDYRRPDFLNDLKRFDPLHGYWIRSGETTAKTWRVSGEAVAVQTPIPLHAGWNLIGYLPAAPDSLPHALATINPHYTYVSGFEAGMPRVWIRNRPNFLNDLRNLKPLLGYWIRMAEAARLIYPAGGYAPVPKSAPFLWTEEGSPPRRPYVVTPYWCDFWGVQPDLLSEGDTIRAYDPQGVLCGQTAVTPEGGFIVHVFGDDPSSPEDEGAVHGDTLRFTINGWPARVVEGDPIWVHQESKRITLALVPSEGDSLWCRFWGLQPGLLSEGDTIRAYDPDGILCGETLVDDRGAFSFIVRGDDPRTPGIDEGAVAGDTLCFTINGDTASIKQGSPVWIPGGTCEIVFDLSVPGWTPQREVLPTTPRLFGSYPNPFNAGTRIRFRLPTRQAIRLSVFDQNGKEIVCLSEGVAEAGLHDAWWDGTTGAGIPAASGVYFIRLVTKDMTLTQKCVMVK